MGPGGTPTPGSRVVNPGPWPGLRLLPGWRVSTSNPKARTHHRRRVGFPSADSINVREIGGDFGEIGENLRGYRLSWSPDGQRLAFDLWLEEEDTQDIFVAEGERLDRIRRLTFEKGCCPHWSPAGDQIAYFSKGSLKFVQPDQPTGVRALSWGEIKNQHQ